jgi:hypothetical protein
MSTNSQFSLSFLVDCCALRGTVAITLFASFAARAEAVNDVLLQTIAGKIVTGIIDDESFEGTLGQRVFRQQFLSNFRSANPGFVSLATGNALMPPGAAGFPSNHDVSFDLMPMWNDSVASNLFYWNGADLDGNGLDLGDVEFTVPISTTWDVFDANFNQYSANGTDQMIAGGLISRTSSDINPNDGVDTGSIHKHLVLQMSDNDGDSGTSPAQGVYMIAWQARSQGFEASDPFLFVLRTSMIPNAVRDLAADWAEANIEFLFTEPGLLGDYNGNGTVDAADYTVWRKMLGQSGPDLAADGNGDDQITSEDYFVWRENFGTSGGSMGGGSASVPEPGSAALVVAVIVLFGAAGRRLVHRGSGEATTVPTEHNPL